VTVYSVAALITVRTFSAVLNAGLVVAQGLGLDTTSWRTGDPTRSTYYFLADALSNHDGRVAEFIKAGFLSSASGDWLTIVARDLYGVDRVQATFATATVTVKNNGGGFYPIKAGDLTFKSTISGKTYHNVSDEPNLSAGIQLTIAAQADDSGSDSSAGVNEIDSLVTTKLGVDVLSSTAAVGLDQQSDDSLKEQCLATRGALSPNGPPDAYEYVVRNPELTGVQDITRAKSDADNPNLDVTVYVASPSGPVAGASVTAAQAAVELWATPLCITPTVLNAVAAPIVYHFTPLGDGLPADLLTTVQAALALLVSSLPIGVGAGYDIDPTTLTTAVRNAVPQITGLSYYFPSSPVHIAAGQVPVIGSVTIV
jgi:hypothetical protein